MSCTVSWLADHGAKESCVLDFMRLVPFIFFVNTARLLLLIYCNYYKQPVYLLLGPGEDFAAFQQQTLRQARPGEYSSQHNFVAVQEATV